MNKNTQYLLNSFSIAHGYSELEMKFLTSQCCTISKIEKDLRDNPTFNPFNMTKTFNIINSNIEFLKPYLGVFNDLEKEGFDLNSLIFEVVEIVPAAESYDNCREEFATSLSFADLIATLYEIQSEKDSYGLDINRFEILNLRKNSFGNYVYLSRGEEFSTMDMDISESLNLLKLSKFFPVKESEKLKAELLSEEKIFVERKILDLKSDLKLYSKRLLELNGEHND